MDVEAAVLGIVMVLGGAVALAVFFDEISRAFSRLLRAISWLLSREVGPRLIEASPNLQEIAPPPPREDDEESILGPAPPAPSKNPGSGGGVGTVPVQPSAGPSAPSPSAPSGTAPTLLDHVIAANPHSALALRLRGGPTPRTPPEWLEWIAREMDGQAVLTESRVAGHVTWLFRGRRFYYYERTLQSGSWTFVVCRIDPATLPTLQIRVRRGETPFAPLPFLWNPPLGIARFDEAYELRFAQAAVHVGAIPGHAVLQSYLALERHVGRMHVLESSGHRCRVGILGIRPQRDVLRALLLDACRLLDEVITPHAGAAEQPTGFQLLDVLRSVVEGAPHCGVCGEALGGPILECARCGAPHHEDCWTYTGGCAIYACLGKEVRRRELAPSVPDPATKPQKPELGVPVGDASADSPPPAAPGGEGR